MVVLMSVIAALLIVVVLALVVPGRRRSDAPGRRFRDRAADAGVAAWYVDAGTSADCGGAGSDGGSCDGGGAN